MARALRSGRIAAAAKQSASGFAAADVDYAIEGNTRRNGALPFRRPGDLNHLQPQFRVNGRIRAREVRVILGSSGQQLGVMKLSDALREAQNRGLDLVEVAPMATPPVCKIVSLGKFRYDLSKHDKDRKPSGAKLKEIKFRVNIDEHDYLTKVRHGEEFLERGNKVRVQLQFRGREMAHQEFGMQLMEKVRDDLAGMSQVEMEPKITGRNITMTLTPLPANRRKRRFLPPPKEKVPAAADSQNGSDS